MSKPKTFNTKNRKQFFTYGVDLKKRPYQFDCFRPPDSPLYPLPEKFHLLGPEEQSWWRVNACSIQERPEDLPIAYGFFFFTYLWDISAAFLDDRREPPDFHYRIIHEIASHHFNAIVAPRYACKTIMLAVLTMLLCVTRRRYRMAFLASKQKKYREWISRIAKQFEYNQLLHTDFGQMKARTGWTVDEIELAPPYLTKVTGLSLDAGERGWHGEFMMMDDPERDPDTDEVIPENVQWLDLRIRKTFMSMIEIAPEDLHRREINRVGRGMVYTGTIIAENMMLNKIATSDPGGPWDAWNKWKFEREIGGKFLWEKRWGKKSTEVTIKVMGEDAYDSECLNRPGKSQVGAWKIHPVFHAYHLDEVDREHPFLSEPYKSRSIIRWGMPTGNAIGDDGTRLNYINKSMLAYEFVSSMTLGVFVDPHKLAEHGKQKSSTSDYTAMQVFGSDVTGTIWSLDLLRGRYTDTEALDALFNLCYRWRPSYIAMEKCGIYGRMMDELYYRVQERMMEICGYVPYPIGLGPFTERDKLNSKTQRIGRVTWRWLLYKIRFPWWRRNTDPYDQCWYEHENFTEDMKKLTNDDVIDTTGLTSCVSMTGGKAVKQDPWEGATLEELIMRGQFITEGGQHIVDMIPSLGELSPQAFAKLEEFYANTKTVRGRASFGREIKALSGGLNFNLGGNSRDILDARKEVKSSLREVTV